jgi:hypothetical protein
MKKLLLAGVCVAGLLSVNQAHAVNYVVNGGFEAPVTEGWSVYTTIPGWTTTFGPGIEIQNNVDGAPYEPKQHVELDSYDNSGMVQSVPTPAGEYQLSFAYSPRPNVGEDSNGIYVKFGSFSFEVTGTGGAATSWTVYSFPVKVDGTTDLFFGAFGRSDSYGGYIDDVRVTAGVPDGGSTLALLGGSLLGIGALGRRLRK